MDFLKLSAALGMPQDVGSQALRQAIARKAMGLDQPAVVDKSAMPADVGSRAIQQSIFDNAFKAYQSNQPLPVTEPNVEPVISNEPDARASEVERMRQQYGAGSSFWNTDEGKDMLLDTMSNQYTGDQAGLPGFYQDQAKAGLGQLDMIKKGLGYEEGSAMAKWADANPALALREYNKRQPNAYAGTGPSDEEIKAAMEAGEFSPSAGSPNPLGETGMARESNTAQTAQAQPVGVQAANSQEAADYAESGVPGLKGKQMLGRQIQNMIRRGFN